MKNLKTFQVVMLPTEKAHEIGDIVTNKVHGLILYDKTHKDNEPLPFEYQNQKSQHLYITSDSIIKAGDWALVKFYAGDINERFRYAVVKCTRVTDLKYFFCSFENSDENTCRTINELDKEDVLPIVASTDKLITPYALITKSFVNVYIEAYINKKTIKTVNLEVVELRDGTEATMLLNGRPKTRPDGSVIIHPSKTYSYNEMSSIVHKVMVDLSMYLLDTGSIKGFDSNKSIEENS